MNNPESNNPFRPKQALAPSAQLYDELVGDGMESLAKATIAEILPISPGAVILDNGCGTGAGTAAVVAAAGNSAGLSIRGIDVNEGALALYKQKAAEKHWPAITSQGSAEALPVADSTFSHSIGTALLFVLPNDGVPAIKEMHRTLQAGGVVALNSWAYVPNMQPIRLAAQSTRPEGTPLPRAGKDKWENPDFLRDVIEQGGFVGSNIKLVKRDVYVTTTDIHRYATLLWSFIGGTSAAGWLESDEEKWDEAVQIVKEELRKSDGYAEIEGGRFRLKFVANIAIATK